MSGLRNTPGDTGRDAADGGGIRLDKWLWRARFFKSRSLASKVCAAGRIRVDGAVVTKPHYLVRVGNVLTFAKARDIRVVRIEALGARRGPAGEARTLYSDVAPAGASPEGHGAV